MSFVTTPMRSSPASSRHRAAIRLLLPDPTGPPTPIRMARASGRKETLPPFRVDIGGQLEADRRRSRLACERAPVGGDDTRCTFDLPRLRRDPRPCDGGVEGQPL